MLRVYAGVLGIGFQLLDAPHALAQSLEEHRHKDLILIDTPGCSAQSIGDLEPLGRFFASRSDVDVQLVLPALLGPGELLAQIRLFAPLQPNRLVFTHLDSDARAGAMLEAAALSGLPISFCCAGQRVPEDLEPADPSQLVERALPALEKRKAAAF